MSGKMMVSPGMSLVAAGIASGICFLLFNSIRKGKSGESRQEAKQIPLDENRCACCLKQFFVGRGVRCSDCGARSCRRGCSRWDTSENAWHCLFCRQRRYWLNKTGLATSGGLIDEKDLHRFFNTAKSRVYVAGVENAAACSSLATASAKEEANAMETVRDFVEKIVEGLIGNVDDTPIDRLYDHSAYKSSTDSSTMAHTALREIVERAVEEARKLPGLGSSGETGRQLEARNITEHSYEDLLATAILNKVIEKFQKEQVDGNSNVLHGKPVSAIKCESETGVDEGVEEGCSSLEPLSQDDCNSDSSASCSRHVRNQPEPLSLTIEERIEEVTTTYASDEDPRDNDVLAIRNTHRVPFPELGMDIIDPSQESEDDSQDEPDTPTAHIGLVSPIESWEENWLFQKKRVQTQADPVAMLVPNPSGDFKAMIGDKDAEDTSDLSECSSAQSDEEIEKELLEAINNVVPRSPKETTLGNGLDECPETSSDASTKENCSKTLSNGFQDSVKPDSRVPADTRAGDNEIARTEDFESDLEIDEEGERSETRDVEEEIEISEKVHGKLVPESGSAIEMEQRTSKDTENANVRNSSDFIENDSLSSLPEESVPDVPKTPMSTPRRSSVTEVCLEDADDSSVAIFDEEHVLNSLEHAKKKLMAVDDDTVETFKEIVFDQQRGGDFHAVAVAAEDIQQESEYTEHYDIAIQRHLDSLTKTETSGAENGTMDESENTLAETKDSRCRKAVAVAKAESASQTSLRNKKSEEDVRLATPPRPGTIAEREHKKWENAPPIENNPYSEENIQKRLWERQYTRRSSDIPGIHAELPKSNGTDLEVVLAPQEPDIKRFGRDYYINESKSSSLEKGRRSAASTSSRPSSSLSQRSSSTGADQEQQEDTPYKEAEFLLNRSNDVKSKVAKWQRNNSLETKYQSSVRHTEAPNDTETQKIDEKYSNTRKTDCPNTWEDQRMEEILENERKNSKNEINAKLNNQENYDSPIIETRKPNSDENQRKIKRIDLKAYGFENAFRSNDKTSKSAPRVVNKLDLKSFGYDGGIRRTQSNIHLNSIVNENDCKPRIVRVTNKSNLSRHNGYDAVEARNSGNNNMTQSTEALHELENGYNNFKVGLKSAKSVPNLARYYSNASSNQEDEEVERYSQNSYESGAIKNGTVRNIASSYSLDKCSIKNSDTSVDESENDTDNSYERERTGRSMTNGEKRTANEDGSESKVLPMPSVRRLAEAFSKKPEPESAPVSKINKPSNASKDRSSTPEVQIVETPRQMHSLTARSLSKQFREGLRQIPNKVASPPASHVAMEQPNIPETQTEVVPAKSDDPTSDTKVILPGKLKSNIIFWEQMQRKS
ncbi:uncharacterized protein LOC122399061 isoform X5 [Colletes gigas]|uniref:uncharacterized protein LOC122399061 isoform X5 n=1 Tax=Colletes gigas TaxID=935657 RepID=UPI001C9A71D4|nr:uncharacterized protein LOC122399061 isoform X5 [Colletes gigas]